MSLAVKKYDVLILGGGIAGLFCAYNAQKKGLSVAVVEQNDKLGVKLRLAGGGMGNMTNRGLGFEHYISQRPQKAQQMHTSLTRKFNCESVLALLRDFDIPFNEREYGQIFCLKPVSHFVKALEDACTKVDFYLGKRPKRVYYQKVEDREQSLNSEKKENEEEKNYILELDTVILSGTKLVLATGSPAYPQIGASDFGARLAAKWGHEFHAFSPVLVPFVIKEWAGLEGISLDVRMHCIDKKQKIADPCDIRPLLFTHQGISGPAVLVLSCFWQENMPICIDFLPRQNLLELMNEPENGKKLVKTLLLQLLPHRLAYRLMPERLERRKIAELSKKDRLALVSAIHEYTCIPEKTQGFKKAEAARGGVCLEDISNQMESMHHKGLYFCGEVLDMTGLLGGYNIHFALASAKRVADSL